MKIKRQRKCDSCDRFLPKVKLCQNRPKGRCYSPKGRCYSLPKKRTREAGLQSRLSKGQTQSRKRKGLVKRSVKKIAEVSTGEESRTWRSCRERCMQM